MADTISKRRTHYEVLGLSPAATSEEIERAFVREFSVFRPHTFGGIADVSVAYETLRNPARRRAYDASLGLGPEAAPRQSPMAWRIGSQFLTATPVMRPALERPAPPEPQVVPQPHVEVPDEPQAVPFIAATLRGLASPEPLRERLEARARPQAELPPPAPEASEERRVYLALDDRADAPEAGAIPWKRAGILVAVLGTAVALLGAWAGWDSAGSAEPAENVAKAVLPPPTTYSVSDPAAAAPARVLDEATRLAPKRSAHAKARVAQARPTTRLAELDRQLSEPDPAPIETPATASAPAEAPAPVAASLPLPNRVIARTIERIGYPCGQIASTAQSGAPGVFKVTCTSGHSYQAAPVRGRYHFRRLAGG